MLHSPRSHLGPSSALTASRWHLSPNKVYSAILLPGDRLSPCPPPFGRSPLAAVWFGAEADACVATAGGGEGAGASYAAGSASSSGSPQVNGAGRPVLGNGSPRQDVPTGVTGLPVAVSLTAAKASSARRRGGRRQGPAAAAESSRVPAKRPPPRLPNAGGLVKGRAAPGTQGELWLSRAPRTPGGDGSRAVPKRARHAAPRASPQPPRAAGRRRTAPSARLKPRSSLDTESQTRLESGGRRTDTQTARTEGFVKTQSSARRPERRGRLTSRSRRKVRAETVPV